MQQQLVTFAISATTTPHRGFARFDLDTHEHIPMTICGTTAAGLAPINEDTADSRLCQSCERGEAVLLSQIVRPEVRLLAGARSTAAGHYLIDGTSGAYCGKDLSEDTPGGDKVCKVCATLHAKVAAFSQAWESEQAGYEVELDGPIECNSCEWVGRYADGSTKAYQEWAAHEVECPVIDGQVCTQCRGTSCPACGWTGQPQAEQDEAELAATVAAVAQAEAADGTWRGEWITSGEEGQQLTLAGIRPDAQQGCLFA